MACTAGTVRADEPVRVACVGNSITQGVGHAKPIPRTVTPGVLRQLLGQGYDVRNFGYSGRTAPAAWRLSLPARTDAGRRSELPARHSHRQAGDKRQQAVELENSTPTLNAISPRLSSRSAGPKACLASTSACPYPAFLAPGSIDSAVIAHEVVPAVRRVARRLGAHVVDLHTPMKAYARCFPDGIHPNEEGAARMAALVYEALTGREAPDYSPGQPFPGRRSEWEGYARATDFVHAGREATVVAPRKAAPGRPWIWRPAFFRRFPLGGQGAARTRIPRGVLRPSPTCTAARAPSGWRTISTGRCAATTASRRT